MLKFSKKSSRFLTLSFTPQKLDKLMINQLGKWTKLILSKTIFSIGITSLFFNLSTFPANSENILAEITRTGVLKVGIRADAIPFGYRDNNKELRGICFDFVNILKEDLKATTGREIILVKIFISSLYNRFEIVEDQIVHLECGPNTIREIVDYEVEFSEPFFITGTKFFTKSTNIDALSNSQGNNLRIGLLRYTTTEKFIRNKYPEAKFESFQGVKGTLRAMQAVQQGRLDAFANDGILLLGQAVELNLDNDPQYAIVPQVPYTCEKYGLILPKNDFSWINFVNSTIDSTEDSKLLTEWFSVLRNDLIRNEEACQQIIPSLSDTVNP